MKPFTTSVSATRFFALTFLLSWLIWIPLVLSHFGVGPFQIPEETSNLVRLLGVLMPAVSALILTSLAGGRRELKALLSRLFIWQVNWRWWAAAVLIQPILLILTGTAYSLFAGRASMTLAPFPSMAALIVNMVMLLIASMGEEIGWRGLALPALQQRINAIEASAILGMLWATWHLPFWLLLDTFDQFGAGYLVMNFLLIMPSTFYITWFFNHGKMSLLLAVMFHLAFNVVNAALFPVTTTIGAFWILIACEWVLALALLPHLALTPGQAQLDLNQKGYI